MLKYLHIENIAVIEKTDIEFDNGFNVLTGETGAGKSILIDAINAILGERTPKDLIRNGCDTAYVSAAFGDISQCVQNILKDNGISLDDDGNVVVLRKLSLNGKGIIRINDQPVTAATLKNLGKVLINIHGQHDNQDLLNPDNHITYIDTVAANYDHAQKYYAEFKHLNAVRRELESLETDDDQKQRKIDLLSFQIKELEDADLHVGELDELKKKQTLLKNHEKIIEMLIGAYNYLNGNTDNDGAITLCNMAIKNIESVNSSNTEKINTSLNEAFNLLQTANSDIKDFIDNNEFSENDAENIGARIDLLHKLMLKYGNTEQKMIDFLFKSKNELASISLSDKKYAELSDELDKSTQRLIALADILSASRKKTATTFESQVCNVLEYLNMPDVKFKVNIEKGRYTKFGCDKVEFMISANAGEQIKPLHKIASGGELSRVMLAIKSVLANRDSVNTLIFDEIDTGISGYAAGKVGIQLKKVSANKQVICVTHLAQIAAEANYHLLIEKKVESGRTFTKVYHLDYEKRIEEIARIMSGTQMTENLFNSAKELLDRSKNNANL